MFITFKIPIIPLILVGVATTLIVMANFVFYTILGEVNSRLSPTEQISPFFVNVKSFKVMRLHKEFFPESRKPRTMWMLTGFGFALIFVSWVLWVR